MPERRAFLIPSTAWWNPLDLDNLVVQFRNMTVKREE